MQTKSFYKEAPATAHALFIFSIMAMVGFSLYLTSHYYEVKFPSGVTSASLCNLNSFFNCDVATNSPASHIFGVPISLFGALIGLFSLFGYLFPSEKVEGTNRTILLINAVGCILLLLYSLIALGGLCPFCTLYYAASFLAAFIIWKQSSLLNFHFIPIGIYTATILIIAAFSYNYAQEKTMKKSKQAKALVKSYDALKHLGSPPFDSEYRLASSTPKFGQAPIRITKFSDFECPACQALSETLHKLGRVKKYRGKINIQYFFYPLDTSCNPSMKRPLHQNACRAAYLAACLPNKFSEIEHEIFSQQKTLSNSWIEKVAKREGVFKCLNSKQTEKKVSFYIQAASSFNVRSTPTWLLNGRKIEGALPLSSIIAIVDSLLAKQAL